MAGTNGDENVKVALIQMSVSDDPDANLERALKLIDESARKGAQIVCLPELFRSRYFCQSEDADNFSLAETIPGKTTEMLSKTAKRNGVVLIAGIFEKRTRGLYHNSAVVIDADGSLLGTYRKMHIPDDPHFYEKFYFTPGDTGFKVYATKYGKIGVLICWDQWYPEAARIATLMGAQIIFYPTAIGSLPGEEKSAEGMRSAWETVQRGHGIANGVFIASVNRVGKEGTLDFWGSSFVSGPFGEVVAKAGATRDEIVMARCNLHEIDVVRHEWPFLRDRRIDAYKGISSRFIDEKD